MSFLHPLNQVLMQITSWKIQGCSNTLKIRLLRRRIEKEKYGIFFQQETKCTGEELSSIAWKVWKGCESVAIDSRGAVGGLVILWNSWEVNLSYFLETPFTLSAYFHILGTRIKGLVTNVYGPPRVEKKLAFLDSITDIKEIFEDKAWILGEEFNLIRNLDEKKVVYGT